MKKLLLAVLMTCCAVANSAECFTQPVRVIVAIAPGGGFETLTRDFSERLSAKYNVPFIVENHPGAEGAVALGYIVNARPDGNTLLSIPDFMTARPITVGNTQVGITDIAAVAGLVQNTELILMANPDFAPNTVREIIDYAKANPGKLTYSTNGEGTVFHLYTEAYFVKQGLDTIHVPYKGLSAANFAAMSGDVNLTYNGVKVGLELIKTNRLKAIAIVGDHRVADLPGVPTLREAGAADLKFNNKLALFAPAGLPKDIGQCIADAVLKLQQDRTFVEEKMGPFKYIPYVANGDRLSRDLIEERNRTKRVAKTQ